MTGWRRLSTAALLLAATGLALLGGRLYLEAKGRLAAYLIDRAYAKHLEDGRHHRPWPWADLHPIARLTVPRLGVSRTILSGAAGESLAFGLGHVSGTAFPAAAGNSAIAGHRDTWAAFLKDLRPGDEIQVHTRENRRSYRVASIAVVDEHDLSVIEPGASSRLTLITCYPLTGLLPSSRRLIVFGEMEGRLARARAPRSAQVDPAPLE
jgi:sortase A